MTRLAACAACAALIATPTLALDLQGHRGARGLAPEDTLPAFAAALALGVTTLELDVGLTADDVLVISHERRLVPDLARIDGRYVEPPGPLIRSLTLEQVRAYDVGVLRPGSDYALSLPRQHAVPGTPVPTLAALADLVRRSGNNDVALNIETKLSPLAPDESAPPEPFAAARVGTLRSEGLSGRAAIQSFDWRTLQVAQRIAPEIATVYLTLERGRGDNIQRGQPGPSPWTAGFDVDDYGGSVPRLVQAAGGRRWSPFYRDLDAAALAEAHALGIQVIVWTVNEEADMERLIDMGVDGIISDYPDRLRKVAAARNLPLPAPTPVDP